MNDNNTKKKSGLPVYEIIMGVIGLAVVVFVIIPLINSDGTFISNAGTQKDKVEKEINPEDILIQANTYLIENKVISAEQKLNELRKDFPDFTSQKEFMSIEIKIDSIKGVNIKRDLDIALKDLKSFNVEHVTDIQDLNAKVSNLGYYEDLILKAYAHSDEMGKYSRKLMIQLRNTQSNCYPQIRRKYAGFLKRMYWIDDIDVKVLGSRADRIQFIGGTFAANRNIKTYYEATVQMLEKFRYKRADYKWIPSASEYTYYKINSESDSHLSGALEYIK